MLSLKEFMDLFISEEDWKVWERVKDERPPESRRVFPEDRSKAPVSVQDLPSDARKQKVALLEKFTSLFHEKFFDGTWEATARRGYHARTKLEKYDFEGFRIRPEILEANSFGHFAHIEISRVRSNTSEEIIRRFIEDFCGTLVPKQSITKGAINDLALKFYPEHYQQNLFDDAWKSADIQAGWRKSGPPKQSNFD